MPILTVDILCYEAAIFSAAESQHLEPILYGVTDGKAIGTYLEQKFRLYLQGKYEFIKGNSASGIDFPDLLVDVKVTGVRQPQSSCPFKSARQMIRLQFLTIQFISSVLKMSKLLKKHLHF